MAGGGGGGRELDQTPTWALATVCFIIIIISIVLEKVLHMIGHVRTISNFTLNCIFLNLFFEYTYPVLSILQWFEHRKKSGLLEALEKVKGGKYM